MLTFNNAYMHVTNCFELSLDIRILVVRIVRQLAVGIEVHINWFLMYLWNMDRSKLICTQRQQRWVHVLNLNLDILFTLSKTRFS